MAVDTGRLRAPRATVIASLTELRDADQFGKTARELVADVLVGLPRACVPLGANLKRPDPRAWSHRTALPRTDVLDYDRIHGCKGQEFAAVLLSLNDLRKDGERDVLDDWLDERNTEARRVLYVGASRAEHVLAFGGPDRVTSRVRVMLERADVPVRCV